ncbi:MAG: peptidoglycan DD-metalloendopeptidase family protein [Treponema sp.]|nr:peptidoglycan DD-metalloendopeptidase family protein [Treponema sp.]
MEIIDCLQPSSPLAMRRFRSVHPVGDRISAEMNVSSLIRKLLAAKKFRLLFEACAERISMTFTAEKIRLLFKRILFFWWILPSIFALYAAPKAVYAVINRVQSFTDALYLDPELFSQSSVDEIMLSSAGKETPLYDSEGNLLSDTGVPLKKAISFRDKVTFRNYTVKNGESISTITKKFSLKNMSTLLAVNSISNARNLRSGQKIVIPSIDGLYHTVQKGESISSIIKKYSISENDLLDVNDMETAEIIPGAKLFIPGAKLDSVSLQKAMGELFSRPIKAGYRITDVFGPRIDPIAHVRSYHSGIDLACPSGTPIYPAMSGVISLTGWSNVYGNYVIISHIDGYQTLYGHMSKITCKKGDRVNQSDMIGKVGSTGYSTGNHLHFTVYKNGNRINPEKVVKLR